MTASSGQDDSQVAAALHNAVEVLLSFGASMFRAGGTAIRTREWIEVLAQKMDVAAVSVGLSLDSIAIRLERHGASVTTMRDLRPPGVNASRIGELENLARTAAANVSPDDIAAALAKINSRAVLYPDFQIALAIAAASGALAFINGGAALEIIAAGFGGGIGQGLRSFMARRQLNQYGTAALSAVVAAGGYVLLTTAAGYFGFGSTHHPAGFFSSVLFLVPGFPLIAALFDLLQYQTVAAISRFSYGVMILLAVAFGLSLVIAIGGVDLSAEAPFELSYPMTLVLRAVASFVAGSAFAMLFNNSRPMVVAAGLLAVGANGLRLVLGDFGMMPAPAAFLGALVVAAIAMWAGQRFEVPRVAIATPPIIIMVPGLAAFRMIVFFNRGAMPDAIAASATCAFGIGALAAGLATVRLLARR